MNKDIIISESDLAGFSILTEYDGWRVGVVNFTEKISIEKSPSKIERHLETDEVFIPVKGKAVLYIGKQLDKYEMNIGKIYNVPSNVWHAILIEKDAKVFVVENADTGEKNTEYIYF